MRDLINHGLKLEKNQQHRASERFVSSLRAYVLIDLANEMREDFEKNVQTSTGSDGSDDLMDGVAVHKQMRGRDSFNLYSSLRCAAQELVWNTAIDFINSGSSHLEQQFEILSNDKDTANGSLQLSADLPVPEYYEVVDVHLMPGNYQGADAEAGLLPGALYDNGFNVFAFGAMGEEFSDIGWSMAKFIQHRFPDFEPELVVDVGCAVGHNTLPWKQTFPMAEVHGVDLAAGCLKYAHARAQSMGVTAHFHWGSSDSLDFADNSVDLVFSSMFLHELPRKHIQRFLKEAYRVLKPGGIMLHMELPPNAALTPYDSFYLDWDSYYNNEPFYKNFRDQDYQQLCTDAGFGPKDFFQAVMPRYTYVEEEVFKEAIAGEAEFDEDTGRLSHDIEWYGFGAMKSDE